MARERRVARIEVSTDGGVHWQEAQITTRNSSNIWVTWGYRWSLPESGGYQIVARATDDAGDVQPRDDDGADAYDGRTGWHRVSVNVLTATS